MNVKLALVQMEIVQGDPKVNLEKAEHYVAQAAKKKANIVAFPEDFLTGPVGKEGEDLVDFEGKYTKLFSKLAQKNRVDVVTGSWIEGSRHGWRNVSHYIDCSGKIKGVYHKVNLWIPERTYLTAGNTTSVFHTRFGKVGLSICWDLAFPEFYRALVRRGARLVFCPSYWVSKDAGIGLKWNEQAEIETVNALCSARAAENSIVLSYINGAGAFHFEGREPDPLIGQTQVTVPFRGCTARLDTNTEQMLVSEIDMSILKDADKAYRLRDDLKQGLVQ